ncbi:MAG: hypothetical protein QOD00_64 [Blastocatellia bacterium]|jgi:hypothetical protein|nr:hypothetical protein [Blastocatellia bacterium]
MKDERRAIERLDSSPLILHPNDFRLALVVRGHKGGLWHATLFDVAESLRMHKI